MHLLLNGFGYLTICLLIAFAISPPALALHDKLPTQVLILASYNPGQEWEGEIISGVERSFAIYLPDAAITTEYMDAKRIDADKARLDYLASH